MALIACRECGQSVSDEAMKCPKCGVQFPGGRPKPWFPVPEKFRARDWIVTALLLAITVPGLAILVGRFFGLIKP